MKTARIIKRFIQLMLWVLAIPAAGLLAFGVVDEGIFPLLVAVPLLIAAILHKAFNWVFAED